MYEEETREDFKPSEEGLLRADLRLEREELGETPGGGLRPRVLGLLSLLAAMFFSLSTLFLLGKWLEHPLIREVLRDLSRERLLLYLSPLFLLITSFLSITFSNLLLKMDWRRISREEERFYRRLITLIISENSALAERWSIREVRWSLRRRKRGYLVPWKLLSFLLPLAFLLLLLGLISPEALPERLSNVLFYGRPERTQLDQEIRLLESQVNLIVKSYLEELMRRINLMLRW
mgnify:CR=1 FL=1